MLFCICGVPFWTGSQNHGLLSHYVHQNILQGISCLPLIREQLKLGKSEVVVLIFINFQVYLIAFQYLLFSVLCTINWVVSWPFLSLFLSLSSQLWTGWAGSLLYLRGSRGSWSCVSPPWDFCPPICQTRRSPKFFFSASLRQPKCNIPLKHNSDAHSSVTFYSKGFCFMFFRIRKVEINKLDPK